MTECIFCKIIQKDQNSDTKIEYENEKIVIFKDIKPASDFHYLAVSKNHIQSAKVLKPEDIPLLDNMENSLKDFLKSNTNLDLHETLFGFHWPPFISVGHLHMHCISPRSKMGFLAKAMFQPNTIWFRTPDKVREIIQS